MRGLTIALIGLSLIGHSVPGYAATLRNTSIVSSGMVRLSDIFSGLEPGQDRVLGPGPAPGSSIHVSGQQLIAIADQYGVEWEDQSSSSFMTITRAGRILDENYFVSLVRKNLPDLGEGPVSITFHDFHPVTVSADEAEPVVLSDVKWDQRSGWFSSTVYRAHPTGDLATDSFMLTGVVHATQRVIVYTHSMGAGSVVSAADVRVDEAYSGHLPSRAVTDPAEVEGQTISRGVVAGSAVIAQDLQRTVIMHKGDPVMITYVAPGLRLSIAGRVLEDAGAKQQVRALNESSGMIVNGKVTDGSNVEVALTSHPVPSDPITMRRLSASMRNPAP
ncbi:MULTISPECIES: flagellar basal body P-ring formation chaperone FlgA [Asaia]|uniref:Flagellar basal-body P-ring formation protein FlgA n=1 Tax=Asaia bogorensis TaxID=91915 RepID=A0A060QM81_9PROT|nr:MULTISPECIES: flagellar basal body P-ring formation chaperone FlgA [Asaia]MDL2170505.1 flagellar basal body P-ring formation chaperone FlgA [Asaia sp. HumB]CDG41067.1 Flagellar basal-body P-ring formation protein FlgA [Asaia bogorensis]